MYKPEPGMKSNLDIDWSNQCDEYTNMIGNFDNVKKKLLQNQQKEQMSLKMTMTALKLLRLSMVYLILLPMK